MTAQPGPPPPPKEALGYLRDKGYKLGWDYRDVWKEEHARAFTVAKVTSQDVLIDIRKAVDDAIAKGRPFKQFREELEPLLEKKGWVGHKTLPDGTVVELGTPRRLKIIYDTNLRTAAAAGQWERIQRTKKYRPYLIYSLGPSREHRHEHASWEGTLLHADDPFWSTHAPPNGWGCKCRLRQVSAREAERLGGETPAPEIERVPWENKRTGRTEHVPKGLDPGWDYNPGAERSKSLKQHENEKNKEFIEIVGKPGKPVEKQKRAVPSVFSTVKGVTADGIEEALRASSNKAQVECLEAFMDAADVKSIVVKSSEMVPRSEASLRIKDDVVSYLGAEYARFGANNYVSKNHKTVGGFTADVINHVVIKSSAGARMRRALKESGILKDAVARACIKHRSEDASLSWTISSESSEVTGAVTEHQLMGTWVHEIGHQVHFYAGSPERPPGAKELTEYSKYNKYEYHAEHFAAWFFNREAFSVFDPEAAKYFDDLVERAIEGAKRKQ